MWVFKNSDDIARRVRMSPGAGFFVDYWLFLHADQTPGAWRVRPLGVRTLGRMSVGPLDKKRDRARIAALGSEFASYNKLLLALGHSPRFALDHGNLPATWTTWVDQFLDDRRHIEFIWQITAALRDAFARRDVPLMAFFARRLSSEIGDVIRPQKEVFMLSFKRLLKDALPISDLVEELLAASDKTYDVQISISPVAVSNSFNLTKAGIAGFVFDRSAAKEEGSEESARRIIAVRMTISAARVGDAVQGAVDGCRRALEYLRTRHYMNVNVSGPITVHDTTKPDCEPVTFALDHPFWNQRQDTSGRILPKLPKNFGNAIDKLPTEEAIKWEAMRWHVSQCLRLWPESIHGAASFAWQAIEAICSNHGRDIGTDLIQPFATAHANEFLNWLIGQHENQRYQYRVVKCDWHRFDYGDRVEWLRSVLARTGPSSSRSWRAPKAPLIWWHRTEGFASALVNADCSVRVPAWVIERIRSDLLHLYAIRNSIVHEGKRIGSDRWAAHVASTGLEVLFAGAPSA